MHSRVAIGSVLLESSYNQAYTVFITTKKSPDNRPITESYIDKKLKSFATKSYLDKKLDKRTDEIIGVVKSLFSQQNEKIDHIINILKGMTKDQANHSVRLNDH